VYVESGWQTFERTVYERATIDFTHNVQKCHVNGANAAKVFNTTHDPGNTRWMVQCGMA